MGVAGVVAGLVDDRVVGRETRERIDMRVGIVALQIAMFEPEHALRAEFVAQQLRNFLAALLGVALMQAAPGSQDRAAAIGLDRAAFQRPVHAPVLGRDEQIARDEAADQAVIAVRGEFAAPAGEAKVGQTEPRAADQGYRT